MPNIIFYLLKNSQIRSADLASLVLDIPFYVVKYQFTMAFDVLVQEAQTYAQENGLFFMETSAKTAKNVNEIFYEIGTDPFFLSYQGIENLQQVV